MHSLSIVKYLMLLKLKLGLVKVLEYNIILMNEIIYSIMKLKQID